MSIEQSDHIVAVAIGLEDAGIVVIVMMEDGSRYTTIVKASNVVAMLKAFFDDQE